MNARAPENPNTEALSGEIVDPKNAGIIVTEKGLDYNTFTGLWRLSQMILNSGLQPRGMDSTEKICVAVARAKTLGLDPFQAMEAFCIINGRAMLYGSWPLALARQHPAWMESGFAQYWEVKGQRVDHPTNFNDDTVTAVAITQRKGGLPHVTRFSVLDAKQAGLWGKKSKDGIPSPWITYPQRMLMHRALGYEIQDNFGDALKGIAIREVMDEEPRGTDQRIDNDPGNVGHGAQIPETQPIRQESNQETYSEAGTNRPRPSIDDLRAKIAAKKKRTQTAPETEQKQAQKTDVEILRSEILDALLARGDNEENMNKRLREVSGRDYDADSEIFHKWMELDTLKNCDDIEWMQDVLNRLRG